MWIGCLQERCCFPNVLWSLCSISCVVTLHPEFPSVIGRQPWLAFHEYTATRLASQGTTRRTDVPQATKGCSDALGTSIMMTWSKVERRALEGYLLFSV
ncbi:hypothetical protein EV363DRAFT_1222368 [Boletus edulis]|nr:hypothetical protein EV363DRAFT_1222368 [Boletus edulis]